MAEATNAVYYVELNDPEKGLNGINIRTFFKLILDRYCDIGQTDIDDNITRFNEAIDPSLPLAVYCLKQEKFQYFMADESIPIYEATMVTTGTKNTFQCGNLAPAWREWRRTPANQQIWKH